MQRCFNDLKISIIHSMERVLTQVNTGLKNRQVVHYGLCVKFALITFLNGEKNTNKQ